jgi:hypothetical protein
MTFVLSNKPCVERKMIKSLWDYTGFLKSMQEEAKSIISNFQALVGSGDPARFLSDKLNYPILKPLIKFLDEYNWLRT